MTPIHSRFQFHFFSYHQRFHYFSPVLLSLMRFPALPLLESQSFLLLLALDSTPSLLALAHSLEIIFCLGLQLTII